jgi:hypothetical protein
VRPTEQMIVGALAGAARRLLAVALIALILFPAPQAVLAMVRARHVQGVSSGKVLTDVANLRIDGASAVEDSSIRTCVAAIRYPFNTSVFRIEVYDTPEAGMEDAAAYYEFPASIVHVKRDAFAGRPDGTLARLLAHELGHMVDMLYFTDKDRADIGKNRGYDMSRPWDDRDVAWAKRPSEDFAETFAQLTQPLSLEPVATDFGPVVGEAQLRGVLTRHVKDRAETLQSIQTERFLNELSNQSHMATGVPLVAFVIQVIVILYALSGALNGFRNARIAVLRQRSMRRRRSAPAPGSAPGTASGHHA